MCPNVVRDMLPNLSVSSNWNPHCSNTTFSLENCLRMGLGGKAGSEWNLASVIGASIGFVVQREFCQDSVAFKIVLQS